MNTYAQHRRATMKLLPDGLTLLAGGLEVPRNFDVNYVFRQKSNFLYLSGVEEPGCHLLLDPKRRKSTLFIPRVDDHHRVWEGHVPGPAECRKLYGFSHVAYADELPKHLKAASRGYRKAYADNKSWKSWGNQLGKVANRPALLADALDDLRAIKTPGELALLKTASGISSRAHAQVMRGTRAGMHEYEVQALFEGACMSSGLRHLAYPSIVAAGVNGAVLHYRGNRDRLRSGDLLLIDAGAEAGGYAADITRTFPINRRFTQRQRDIYSIVLAAQNRCIQRARPGLNFVQFHIDSMRTIAEGLRDLKLLRGSIDSLVEGGACRLFYPHGIGHLLGLDVHDGFAGKRRKKANPTKVPARFTADLEAGFVITVEPGIYFIKPLLKNNRLRKKFKSAVDFTRADRYLNFGGIRIEDDIVIRRSGAPRNLTSVPKEIKAIEELRRRA
jgi:Xaa-Pro dipeptidase